MGGIIIRNTHTQWYRFTRETVNKGGRERGKCHNRHQKSLKNLKKTEKEILVRVLSVQKAAHRRINKRADCWRCRSTRSSLNSFRPFPFLNKRREKNKPDEKHARQITGKEKRKNVLNLARQFTFQIVKQERTGVVPRRCHRNDGNGCLKVTHQRFECILLTSMKEKSWDDDQI